MWMCKTFSSILSAIFNQKFWEDYCQNYMLIHGFQTGLVAGNLLRFAIGEGGLCFADGKLERADLHYLDKPNRARAFADSYSKVSRLSKLFFLFVFCISSLHSRINTDWIIMPNFSVEPKYDYTNFLCTNFSIYDMIT